MAIDRTGAWWTGSEAGDIDDYLMELTADQQDAATTVRHPRCSECGTSVFTLRFDGSEGWAERRCTTCGSIRTMLDSADVAADVEAETARCPCGGKSFNLAVGFARSDEADVRRVYLGLRCTRDDVLGCCADWKIDYTPSSGLVDQV